MMTYCKFISLLIAVLTTFETVAQFPENFTPLKVEVSGKVAKGHIFITPFPLNSSVIYKNNIIILDSVGKMVIIIPTGGITGTGAGNLMLHQNGNLTYSGDSPNNVSQIYVLDSNFNFTDTVNCGNGRQTGFHEIIMKPNGNYVVKCLQDTTMDLSSIFTINGIPGSISGTVSEEMIQEIDQNDNVVWEWKSLDHININDTYAKYFNNPAFLDHSHINSIELDNDGNYIVSFRNLDEISKINSVSGNFMWRLGGKNNQFTLIGDTVFFSGQHDARKHDGNILSIFDNAVSSPFLARGLEYELNEITKTATLKWQHINTPNLSSQFVGNLQKLPNGNKIINWGGVLPSSQIITIIEIDSTGQEVLKIDLPDDMITYRSRKYVLPFIIHRPEIDCDNPILTADSGYSTYYWNTGETTRTITISDTGKYQVWCNYGVGYVSSEEFYVDNLDNICLSTGMVANQFNKSLKLYPNPATNQLNIAFDILENNGRLEISDLQGRIMLSKNIDAKSDRLTIDVTSFAPGIYMANVNGSRRKFIVIRQS